MIQSFYPAKRERSVFTIDYESYYRDGIRGIIFDVDNTLVPPEAPASDEVVQLFRRLHEMGFRTSIISNNDKERVESFANAIGAEAVYDAAKPLSKAYIGAMSAMNTTAETTLFIGDQLLTDIFGANCLHLMNILVDPIDPESESRFIHMKRAVEKQIFRHYQKELEKK